MSFVPHTPDEIKEMLGAIGAKSIEELFQAIPAELRLRKLLNLPGPMSEFEVAKHIKELAGKNISTAQYVSFLGAGCYNHYIPAVVNHLSGRSEFYTSYTPYQAEASQGNLTAFFEYQTMVCELTGMEAANASVYDGATALAEAVLMSLSVTGKKKVIISKTIHPEYRQVLATYLKDLPVRTGDSPGGNAEIIEVNYDKNGQTDLNALQKAITPEIACVAIQNPNFFGVIEECDEISKLTHKEPARTDPSERFVRADGRSGGKSLLISIVNPISLGILKSPGEYNADIVVGEGQSLGNEMYFGGPHLGLFAAKMAYVRKMPGRLVGQTVDKDGKRGFVLTLSTREQHIRREKATSNICSNEALLALRAGIYLSAIGKQGIKKLANLCLQKAHYAAESIKNITCPNESFRREGYQLVFASPFFHEFVIRSPIKPSLLNQKLLAEGIIGGLDLEQFYPELKNTLLFCTTEVNSKSDIDKLTQALKKISV